MEAYEPDQADSQRREGYEAPRIEVLGTAAELTQGAQVSIER
jgi:hypothetical protein